MTEPNEQQAELIRKQTVNPNSTRTLNPDHWGVLEENDKQLVILSKRTRLRRVLLK